jgi:hypothetical protein
MTIRTARATPPCTRRDRDLLSRICWQRHLAHRCSSATSVDGTPSGTGIAPRRTRSRSKTSSARMSSPGALEDASRSRRLHEGAPSPSTTVWVRTTPVRTWAAAVATEPPSRRASDLPAAPVASRPTASETPATRRVSIQSACWLPRTAAWEQRGVLADDHGARQVHLVRTRQLVHVLLRAGRERDFHVSLHIHRGRSEQGCVA